MASLGCDISGCVAAEAPAAAQSTRNTTHPSTKIDSSFPVSVKESSTSTSASLLSQSQQSLHAGEMDDRAAEISIETFLDEFTDHIEIPDLDRAKWLSTTSLDSLHVKEREVDTYAPLLDFLRLPLDASPDLTLLDNRDLFAKGERNRRRLDIGIYPRNRRVASKVANAKAEEDRHPNDHQMNLDTIVVPIEVKWREGQNAFGSSNSSEGFLPLTIDATRIRDQITKCAAKIMARQHRTCLFSIFIHRFTARLLRWDRVGVVISEPIHYKEDPTPLITFLYRLGQMPPEDRGIDSTVTAPTQEEKDQLDNFEPDNASYRRYRDNTMPKGCPIETIFKVVVADTTQPTATRRLLISKAQNARESVTGRGTKGFVAYDLEDDRLVWLKDCWRVDSSGSDVPVHTEHETYARLREHGVKYVATAICGGDVESPQPNSPSSQGTLPLQDNRVQTTLNQRWVTGFRPKIHYRLVVEEIGRKLETYEHSLQLCYFVACALRGHEAAWIKANILHRDVSPGNILIDDRIPGQLKAFLNDWDLCKYKEDLEKGPSDKARSGTWQFLSAMLLKFPKKRYELADDLESFVHLLCWFAIRFHKHDASPTPGMEHDLHQLVTIYETHGIDQDGYDRGGNLKYQAMCNGFLGFTLDPDWCPSFRAVLERLMEVCKEHYAAILAEKPSFMRDSQSDSTQPGPTRLFPKDHGGIFYEATKPQQLIPSLKPEAKLKTHTHILRAISDFANDRKRNWYADKEQDQFEYLPVSTTKTYIQPGTHSRAEKRKAGDSSDRNAKRAKATSGTRLESITESL